MDKKKISHKPATSSAKEEIIEGFVGVKRWSPEDRLLNNVSSWKLSQSASLTVMQQELWKSYKSISGPLIEQNCHVTLMYTQTSWRIGNLACWRKPQIRFRKNKPTIGYRGCFFRDRRWGFRLRQKPFSICLGISKSTIEHCLQHGNPTVETVFKLLSA